MCFFFNIYIEKYKFTVDLSKLTLVSRSSCREEFLKKGVPRNSCHLTLRDETFEKFLKKYLWSLHTCNLAKNWTSSRLFFKDFDQLSKQLFFRTAHSNCIFMFMKFNFCWDIVFLFYSLKTLLILVCGLPVWTRSPQTGGRLPPFW